MDKRGSDGPPSVENVKIGCVDGDPENEKKRSFGDRLTCLTYYIKLGT